MQTVTENGNIVSLIQAIKSNNIFQIRLLIQEGVNVNQAYESGLTPLHHAAQESNHEVINTLLDAEGIEVNQGNINGITPLHMATEMCHTEVVKVLLNAKGIDVNHANNICGQTPLHMATEMRHTEVVKVLLDAKGIDVNKLNGFSITPLHIATQNSHLEVAQALLENGADYSQLDSATQLTFKAEIAKIDQTKKVFAGDLSIPATEINENHLRYLCKQSAIPQHLLTIDQDKPNRSDYMNIVNRIRTNLIDPDISKGVGKKRTIDEVEKLSPASAPASSTRDATSAPYLQLMRLSINDSSRDRKKR